MNGALAVDSTRAKREGRRAKDVGGVPLASPVNNSPLPYGQPVRTISPWPPGRGELKAELAYGFTTGEALLTPHMDLLFSQGSSTYGVGVRYGLGSGLDLDLKTTTSQGTGSSETNILLELQTEL